MVLYFYPRSPRGERQVLPGDTISCDLFLSTLPARGATLPNWPNTAHKGISIHAPREGSDSSGQRHLDRRQNFYPRSPRGERRFLHLCYPHYINISIHAPREGSDLSDVAQEVTQEDVFLSTLPARGATLMGQNDNSYWAPFLSTLPARGATMVGGFSPYAV